MSDRFSEWTRRVRLYLGAASEISRARPGLLESAEALERSSSAPATEAAAKLRAAAALLEAARVELEECMRESTLRPDTRRPEFWGVS